MYLTRCTSRLKRVFLWSFFVASHCLFVRKTNVCHQNKIAATGRKSFLRKKEENKTTRNTCLKMQKIRVHFFLLEIQSPIICANNAFFFWAAFWWNYRQMWEFSDVGVNIRARLAPMLTQLLPFVKSNGVHCSFTTIISSKIGCWLLMFLTIIILDY